MLHVKLQVKTKSGAGECSPKEAISQPGEESVKRTYQMLHSSARDCGWSLMMAIKSSLGLRRRRNHAWIEAMLR